MWSLRTRHTWQLQSNMMPRCQRAPIVIAKGEDYLAQKIREKAKENHIEIVENKPLARMLYANVDIGAEIPPELYQAVAEILAMVYNMRNREDRS